MSNDDTFEKLMGKAQQLTGKYRGMLQIKSFSALCLENGHRLAVNCFDPLPSDVQDQIRVDAQPFQIEFASADRDDIWP